ncbi:6-carboxytetrahydropterin synthase QueD [[Limnothrix rosea] IAM M-220]|uniref:6-carboxytetrahydropterin synthase QueD n=1 Tax=[Limnothrix rosea] IAM M-220 TaxID=454133 RepID=UPI000962D6BA|nr:6-carboxytetrahydropterin synthase QueD [[Limnothrix rosea] IAM M-220]OKH18771.1 6-carboxytetrahydropterin synthase QueD [[Limnothrix rosea] IAM M-220]
MEQWQLYKEFRFEAAHRLPHHDGKCARLHGHSWVCRVYIRGDRLIESGAKQGMLMDFSDLKSSMKPLLEDYLDHYYLNETLEMESPTSEAIAKWIYEQLEAKKLMGLCAVEILETCTSGCIYSRPK